MTERTPSPLATALLDLLDRSTQLMILDADTGYTGPVSTISSIHGDRLVRLGSSESELAGTALGLVSTEISVIALLRAHAFLRVVDGLRSIRLAPPSSSPAPLLFLGLEDCGTGFPSLDISAAAMVDGMATGIPVDGTELRQMVFRAMTPESGITYVRVEARLLSPGKESFNE